MIEKVVLAIAITFSLYSIVQIKPPQRAVATDIYQPVATLSEQPTKARANIGI